MGYCSSCGRQVDGTMSFCPGCGAALQSAGALIERETAPLKSDYRVILLELGSCRRESARDLLVDLLGYSEADAREIVKSVPTEVARCLTEQQACTLAQALTEYGMQVAVCDEDDYVDLSSEAVDGAYSEDGTLLASALAVLATLGLKNRVDRVRPWERPCLLERLFTPRVRRPVPPRIRHHIHPVYTRPVRVPTKRPIPPTRNVGAPRTNLPDPRPGGRSTRPGGSGGNPGRGPRPASGFGHMGGSGGRGPGRGGR